MTSASTNGTSLSGGTAFGSGAPGAKETGGSTCGSKPAAPSRTKKRGAKPTATAATLSPSSWSSFGGSRRTSSSTSSWTRHSHAFVRVRSIPGSSVTPMK